MSTTPWELHPSIVENASIREAVPMPEDADTRDVMAHVLRIALLRQELAEAASTEASEQKRREEQLIATDEIKKTISELVDKLETLNYPLTTVVKGLPQDIKPNDACKSDLENTAIWLLDIPDKWELGLKGWGFGADKQLYSLWVSWEDERRTKYLYHFYAPKDMTTEDGINDAATIRDALMRFEVPAVDPQAELFT